MSCEIKRTLPEGSFGSTYLNSQIDSYGSLVYYLKTMLGFPHSPVELDDGQFKIIIDDAIELYTKWVRGEEKMLIFAPYNYNPSCGIRLDELINPCNTCITTCSSVVVTGISCSDVLLGTSSALLSVTEPLYNLRTYYDLSKNDSPLTSAYDFSQFINLNYNPNNPWNTQDFCDFDKIVIRPKNSDWYELSGNSTVWAEVSSTNPVSSYDISSIPVSSFYGPLTTTTWPLEAYMNVVSGIGNVFPAGDLNRFDVCPKPNYFWRIDPKLSIALLDCNHNPYIGLDACEYPIMKTIELSAVINYQAYRPSQLDQWIQFDDTSVKFLTSATLNPIEGYNIDTSTFKIDPSKIVVGSTLTESISSPFTLFNSPVIVSASNVFSNSYHLIQIELLDHAAHDENVSYFNQFTGYYLTSAIINDPDLTKAKYLSGAQGIIENPYIVDVDLNNDGLDDNKLTSVCYISASDGSIFPPANLNVETNTYIELLNFPYCVDNNQIPLNWNNGIYANFSLCNAALKTFGDIPIPTVKFLSGCLPDSNLFYKPLTGWENGGFQIQKSIKQGDICSLKIPCNIEVDIDFYTTTCGEATGLEVTSLSGSYDYDLGNFRKIQGCFSADLANNGYGGGFGGDNYLFSLDLAVAQNLFGDRLMGNGDSRNRFDLTSYHLAKSYVEQIRKMFRAVTWQFNPKTQYLKIFPEPKMDNAYCYLLGVYLEPTINEVINEEFVKNYSLGKALQIIGKIRGRYGAISLVGGATIAGDAAITEGDRLVTEALADLRDRQRYDIGQSVWTY